MKLSVLIMLASIFVTSSMAQCTTEQEEYNFGTKEQPHLVEDIEETCVQIVGLTKNNLERFTSLDKYFEISHFTIDDVNALNQPNLFARHTTLKQVKFRLYNGSEMFVVHEELFSGLDNLENVALVGLNLETIPEKLFHNLFKLRTINLSSNKLKSLHPNIFATNPKLSYTFLGENQFLQSGIPLDLILLNRRASLSFMHSYVKDFNALLPILGHPNITYINLGPSNLTNIKLNDFAQFPERKTRMYMRTHDAGFDLYIADLKANGIDYEIIPYEQLDKIINISRAYVEAEVLLDSTMCSDCRFIRDVFKAYLRGKDDFNIYLTESKVLFAVSLGCENIENNFTLEYKTNCPEECSCQYNQLLDKVWIDCHGKNLSNIPTIPFPSQFDKITSISLDLSKNDLETFVLANIDGGVKQQLSELNLSENQLKSVNIKEFSAPNLHQINLCLNPFWSETFHDEFPLLIDNEWHKLKKEECSVGNVFPANPLSYISNKPMQALDLFLENFIC